MTARASLLLITSVLVSALALLSSSDGDRPSAAPDEPIEQLLQGTWVPVRVHQTWVVTEQPYDVTEMRGLNLRRAPERQALPVDPHGDSMTLTFSGSQYFARYAGRIYGRGEFTVDRRINPPVLETRGYTYIYHIHEESMSVFGDKQPLRQARLAIRPGQLRVCVTHIPGKLPAGLRPTSEDVYVVTFARMQPLVPGNS